MAEDPKYDPYLREGPNGMILRQILKREHAAAPERERARVLGLGRPEPLPELTRRERHALGEADRQDREAERLEREAARRAEAKGKGVAALRRQATGLRREAAATRRAVEAVQRARHEGREVGQGLGESIALEAAREPEAQVVQAGTALRLTSRDGLASLKDAGTLTEAEVKVGLAYRWLVENAAERSKSQLEARGGGGSAPTSDRLVSAAFLRAYAGVRLTAINRAVQAECGPKALQLLQGVAGRGDTLRSLAPQGGNQTAAARRELRAALDVASRVIADQAKLGVANQSRPSA